jgi:hypothetical protein
MVTQVDLKTGDGPMRLKFVLPFVAGLAAAVVPAAAHHGWGSYDADNPMTLEGMIEGAVLENPHGAMTIALEGEPWLITLAPLSRMNARGATADIVKDGAVVVAYGYPRRDGTLEIRAEWIEVDGQRFELR